MAYQSVDQLQKLPTQKVFHYAKDSKKAAGRALGTLVEIATFYALKSWGFERNLAIERPLPEFANDAITHNVEYSLHPSVRSTAVLFTQASLPLTARKILKNEAVSSFGIAKGSVRSHSLLTKDLVVRNSCTIGDRSGGFV